MLGTDEVFMSDDMGAAAVGRKQADHSGPSSDPERLGYNQSIAKSVEKRTTSGAARELHHTLTYNYVGIVV